MSFVIVGADKVEGAGRSDGQQTSGRKSTLGAGLIGRESVAGRSVGDCSRMVSGSFVQIFVMSANPFGRAGVRAVYLRTKDTLIIRCTTAAENPDFV